MPLGHHKAGIILGNAKSKQTTLSIFPVCHMTPFFLPSQKLVGFIAICFRGYENRAIYSFYRKCSFLSSLTIIYTQSNLLNKYSSIGCGNYIIISVLDPLSPLIASSKSAIKVVIK